MLYQLSYTGEERRIMPCRLFLGNRLNAFSCACPDAGWLLVFMGAALVRLGRFARVFFGVAGFGRLGLGMGRLGFRVIFFAGMRFDSMLFAMGLAGFGVGRFGLVLGGLGGVGRGLAAGCRLGARLMQRLGGGGGLEVAGQRLVFRLGVAHGAGEGQADGDEGADELDQIHFLIGFCGL
ncbi:hypothetical protein [Chromobacterium alticapitis]|uniref:hypothetical protein n=1 Tax=Chromobacterium alticapitis TaxID=2073169 RepID=UPI0011AFF033|nr:hypothetical protein [Chromobacterium alticapitis]